MTLKKFMATPVQEYLNEVRYINPRNIEGEKSIKDEETLRVFHGFSSFDDAVNVLKNGLSGKERARRIYSYESGNNPFGLFVTIDFNMIKKSFAGSGVIIEFSAKVSDLEAPVWVGGRSYYVQGEYTQSFKDLDEREQQRLINRQKSGESPYDYISKSDRPELADTIFNNYEKQALYVGDLDPNMIKHVWFNEAKNKNHQVHGTWVKFDRKDFIRKYIFPKNASPEYRRGFKKYLPSEEFDMEVFTDYYGSKTADVIEGIARDIDNYEILKSYGFWPKQIAKITDMYNRGEFDEYLN